MKRTFFSFPFSLQACNHGAGKTVTSMLCYFKLHCWTELIRDISHIIQPQEKTNLETPRKAFLVKDTCQITAAVLPLETHRFS